jgi:hypothetical protein
MYVLKSVLDFRVSKFFVIIIIVMHVLKSVLIHEYNGYMNAVISLFLTILTDVKVPRFAYSSVGHDLVKIRQSIEIERARNVLPSSTGSEALTRCGTI